MTFNKANSGLDENTVFLAKVRKTRFEFCEVKEAHESHWDPTGETDTNHVILLKVCPGYTPPKWT